MIGFRPPAAARLVRISLLRRRWALPCANLCIAAPAPNNKTLVVLDGLPPSITKSSLESSLSSIETIRKCEVQPGCSLHIVDDAGAQYAAKQITDRFACNAAVRSVCLPSIVLNNVPKNVCTNSIQQGFQNYDPKVIRFSGKRTVFVTVDDAEQAVNALKLVNSISMDGNQLNSHATTMPDGRFCIQISDIPASIELSAMLNKISDVVNPVFPTAKLTASTGMTTITIRVDTSKLNSQLIDEALSRVNFGNVTPVTTTIKTLPKPALVIRNVSRVSEDALRTLCVEKLNANRVQRTWRSKDMYGDLAFAYFSSEKDAYAAIKKLREANIGPDIIKASYRDMPEPGVKISGLAKDASSLKIKEIFSQFRIHRVEMLPNSDSSDDETQQAVVVLSDFKEANRFVDAVNLRKFEDVQYSAEEFNVGDTCVELVFSENEVPTNETLEKSLRNAGLSYHSLYFTNNTQAFIAFDTIERATKALGKFTHGSIVLKDVNTAYDESSRGSVFAKLSVYPSYVVEVSGISQSESAENILDVVTEGNKVEILKSERSATVKFKRHANVIPGMKLLRSIQIGDQKLRPRRFHEIEEEGEADYDRENQSIKVFDRSHLRLMLNDYLTAEPAIRYQIAKNYFERALFTAQGRQDIDYILSDGAPNDVKAEARLLLQEKNDIDSLMKPYEKDESQVNVPKDLKQRLDKTVNRLFQMFIQREDMHQFSKDFDDIEASLGPADPDDAYGWNNFICNDDESLKALAEDLRVYSGSTKSDRRDAAYEKRKADAKQKRRDRREGIIRSVTESEVESDTVKNTSDENVDRGLEDPKDLDFLKEATEKERYDRFNADRLMDYDGHLWSGVIVHQDTTQKVVPGERIMSFRCLVTIGNRRGAGGFGVGKGPDADVALRSAFRDALKNLIYIDLYENAALAHDVKGKHNDCIAYVRATPKAREMVASPLATAIFNNFGIVSCSTKIVGNRHPYSMVRAIFNALSKHKNIDEIAKERGTRYLTLKWMYDNGL